MGDECRLREANRLPGEPCDKQACVFWRVVNHLGEETAEGCAIEHFQLLGDHGIAAWLLSVKERVEMTSAKRDA